MSKKQNTVQKKLQLEDLKVRSFVTYIQDNEKNKIMGGNTTVTAPSGCTGCPACGGAPTLDCKIGPLNPANP